MKYIIMQFSPRSIFLPFRSKYPQYCSQKPSVYVPPSKRETTFRTHTAQLAKVQFCNHPEKSKGFCVLGDNGTKQMSSRRTERFYEDTRIFREF
jgi:hypothetical protein